MTVSQRILDNADTALFLQREPAGPKEAMSGINILKIETQADIENSRWTCGHCGRSNSSWASLCSSCGAPGSRARVRGCVTIEGWLPQAGILYSLVDSFSMYVTLVYRGRRDLYREEECIYILENCIVGPVKATDVVRGCRMVGESDGPIVLQCNIACDCIYVGAPWNAKLGEE